MAERKLVTIRTINDLNPIEGADAIEVATVDGWKLVVKKGEFKVGDACVYFEIDSFLPSSDPRYAFLMKSTRVFEGVEGHKLRTIKLRGQISQGLALPIRAFAGLQVTIDEHVYDFENVMWEQGEDVTAHLGIKKWEASIPANMAGQVEGAFPSFIRKTDQERCQNMGNEIFGYEATYEDFDVDNIPDESIARMIEKGDLISFGNGGDGVYQKVRHAKASPEDRYEVTMKLDGQSVTFYKMDARQGVCSRNLELKVNDINKDNALVKMFIDSGLRHVMAALSENIAIQGELMGPGIQGNREGFKDYKFFIFDVQDLENGTYYTPEMRSALLDDLYGYGVNEEMVKHVPILANNVTLGELGISSVDQLLAHAEGKSINHAVREGEVYKRMDGKFSFKAISNKFLEKEKD